MQTLKCVLSTLLFATLVSSLTFAAAPDRITGAINNANMVKLTGHVTPMARAKDDEGPIAGSQVLHVTMLFTPSAQQQQALQKLLSEQQDPKSAQFHKWLTADEFGRQFGLSPNDISKISAWLKSQGLKVTYVAHGRDFLSFDGTASQVQNVFQTAIHNFNVKGKMHFANITPPMIPTALNGIVGGFRGLHNFFPHPMLKKRPNYTFQDHNNYYAALAPGDIATIYNIDQLYQQSIDGTGENVVIVGQSDVYIADINYFRNAFSFTPLSGCTLDSTNTILQAGTCSGGNFQQVWPNGSEDDPGIQAGDLGESDLDIEWMNSVARGAKIIFVTSVNGVDDSASWAIDNQLAKVISYSYGLCEAFNTAPSISAQETSIYKQAATEGISFFAASGDAAAATCDGDDGYYPATLGLSVSYPASSPNVTGVGGTEFDEGTVSYWKTTNGTNGASATGYIPESAWNDSALSFVQQLDGSGGGASNCVSSSGETSVTGPGGGPYAFLICEAPPNGGFTKPSWQSSLTPSDGVRDVPDMAFSASNVNDPYIVCVPESEVSNTNSSTSTCSSTNDGSDGINTALTTWNSAFGGTSASTPVAAGMTVLLNQYLQADGLGLINPQLYKVFAANPTGVFHEIETGTNSITNGSSSNVVACADGDPSFEPQALRCSSGTFGFSVTGGDTYNQATGLGSVDFNAFFQAWAAADGSFTLNSPSSTVTAGHSTSAIAIDLTPSGGFNSQVAFSCPTLPAGVQSCTFTPSTISAGSTSTSLVITTLPSMSAGTVTVPISATGGGVTSTSSVSLTVNATDQSFTLALVGGNQTFQVTQGSAITVNVTLAGTNGFNAPVQFSCSDPASESNCSGPLNYTTNYTANTPASFTISTTAPTAKLERPVNRGTRFFYAAFLPGLFGILFTAGSWKRSRRMRMLAMLFVLGFSTLWMGGCSGSTSSTNKNPGTPAGAYTISITATTGGQNPVTNNSAPLTFTVNVVAQ